MDSKAELIRSTAKILVPENAEAELVDVIINEFAEQEFEKARILCFQYALTESLSAKIKKSSLGKTTYYHYLGIAERWACEEMNKYIFIKTVQE